jgi:hypothetical protein
LPIIVGVFWEEINERSIKSSKPSCAKNTKEKPKAGSGAAPVAEDHDDELEPEDFMMIEVTRMHPYLAYIINKELP